MSHREEKAFILVVEDDPLMAQGLAEVLSMEGYYVETAPNGRAALAKMRSRTPDMVISDVIMPEMDGQEFCALVRANPDWRTLPFIFLTALDQKADHWHGLELGADDYLSKPFETEELLIAVRARLKRAAAHQAAAEAALADLRTSILTMLNHEFRTPLTFITGYGRLLADGGQEMPQEQFQSCINALLNGAARLRRLVENVLLITQIEWGELAGMIKMFPLQTPNLDEVVQQTVEKHQAKAKTRQVTLQSNIPSSIPPLCIGEEYLTQIIDHLVENAIKFSKPQGGQVTLSAAERNGFVELCVRDQGIGIRPDALAWAFDSFRQVDREQQEQQGAGLGLAIVRGLAQAHGGQVALESEPDVGTTVTVQLPTNCTSHPGDELELPGL